jgi:hypothetical protein
LAFNEHGTAWNLFVGFELNRYLAFEAGRLDGGTPTRTTNVLVQTTPTELFNVYDDRIKNYGWHGAAIGSWPITDEVSIYARGGLLNWHSTLELKLNGADYYSADASGTDPFYGLGLAINVDSGLLRLEYDRAKEKIQNGSVLSNLDVTFWSLGFVWKFKL